MSLIKSTLFDDVRNVIAERSVQSGYMQLFYLAYQQRISQSPIGKFVAGDTLVPGYQTDFRITVAEIFNFVF